MDSADVVTFQHEAAVRLSIQQKNASEGRRLMTLSDQKLHRPGPGQSPQQEDEMRNGPSEPVPTPYADSNEDTVFLINNSHAKVKLNENIE